MHLHPQLPLIILSQRQMMGQVRPTSLLLFGLM
jgi:hypothetical protein